MTHHDIYTKFLIEYDKDNITSSYPSLTQFEIATILDKAYLGLIARKITGNNPRRATFESDIKAVEDLRPLIANSIFPAADIDTVASNEYAYSLPADMLYYIHGDIQTIRRINSIDSKSHTNQLVSLIDHETAQRFKSTDSNLPWIKVPISYIESNTIHVLVDPYKIKSQPTFYGMYIKKPKKFVDYYKSTDDVEFELSDTMAEEMINLAILFALENVESTRLQSKTSTLPLES